MAYRRYFGDIYTYGAAIIKYGETDYMFLSARGERELRRRLAMLAKGGRPTVLRLMARDLWKAEHTSKLMMEEW